MEKEEKNKFNQKIFQEQKNKKRISGGMIFLIIVLIIIGIFVIIYITTNESELDNCNSTEQCEIYKVYTFGGEKQICMNNEKEQGSFKEKLMMFKYNIKQGQKEPIEGCVCENGKCVPSD